MSSTYAQLKASLPIAAPLSVTKLTWHHAGRTRHPSRLRALLRPLRVAVFGHAGAAGGLCPDLLFLYVRLLRSKTTIPYSELAVAGLASIFGGFGLVFAFCAVGANV
ncbi:hypothetical protein Rhopal_005618-T1 [Rhodotorula paludigena]|uniref:Dolichyl-diphosphooligosaccharide-protein glycosyltransferase subunit OST5 n=1 Tax=Rhodotorula paludigena TaxID=86838 RepID=A0AAV5GU65_9BASI|nr:hypothetical protein Rhopal_005618-T1 [Rhodotorula paludigena]